jgi:hypothetical protein
MNELSSMNLIWKMFINESHLEDVQEDEHGW